MAGFGLAKIGQIAVRVRDVEAATAFYRDALGMSFLFAFPGLAFFDCDGTWLMLSRAEAPEADHPASILYFDVPDIDAAFATLQGRGVRFVDAPHVVHRAEGRELWLADFRDLEDNIFAIRSWKPAG